MLLTRDFESFEIPDRLSVLPLRDVVVFPYVVMPLLIGRQASLAAVNAADALEGKYIVLVAQREADTQEPVAADLYRTGVVARIAQLNRLAGGSARILVEALGRVRITRFTPGGGVLRATIIPAPLDAAGLDSDDKARARQALSRFDEYVGLHRRIPSEIVSMAQATASEERAACMMAAHLAVRHDVRQRLLESADLSALLRELVAVLAGEIELLRLERKIDDDVRGSLFRNQREFYLQEQLKAIHRELGQEDADDLDEVEAAIAARGMPEPIRLRCEREVRKLRRTSPISPEATVGRNYLDWLLALPWTERTDDVLDVNHARAVLDEDHYGLEQIKDRILDYIAVLGLVGRLEGPILCLVGPPGVGKTSLGRSIARALGRRFVRMSLGGVRDEAEIRGHRRTYIGALPGRILQAMRRAESVNPVVLLDEIDKLGQDWRGDPAAALLEVLDPEQNKAFNDHYLEVDYDLSGVLFVTTANSLNTIPDALRDRMEILRLAGYLDFEKHTIARQFLAPRQFQRNGVAPESVTLHPDVIPAIVRGYTREAGVRELERRLARVARKVARRRAEASAVTATPDSLGVSATSPVMAAAVVGIDAGATPVAMSGSEARPSAPPDQIVVDDLRELLGVAPYDPDDMALTDRVGVASGLAYTPAGGEVLDIEVSVVSGRGRLQLTGTLGDVMKESAAAALSYARSRARALGIEPDFHRTRDVHVHIPSGAQPKDGPSAGIAIASAIASALSGVPVRGDVAMTGEVTLRGRVLPIGGLKEKAVAALRSGIREIVIPEGNARELEELPPEIRNEVRFVPVATMDAVLDAVLRRTSVRESAAPPAAHPVIASAATSPATHQPTAH